MLIQLHDYVIFFLPNCTIMYNLYFAIITCIQYLQGIDMVLFPKLGIYIHTQFSIHTCSVTDTVCRIVSYHLQYCHACCNAPTPSPPSQHDKVTAGGI